MAANGHKCFCRGGNPRNRSWVKDIQLIKDMQADDGHVAVMAEHTNVVRSFIHLKQL